MAVLLEFLTTENLLSNLSFFQKYDEEGYPIEETKEEYDFESEEDLDDGFVDEEDGISNEGWE